MRDGRGIVRLAQKWPAAGTEGGLRVFHSAHSHAFSSILSFLKVNVEFDIEWAQ